MLTDVRNLALPNIPEDSQVVRINAACEEDAATMHGYIKHLKGITPPEELQLYRDSLMDRFNVPDGLDLNLEGFTVGRRLYRSGESEYSLDGRRCRLKDIQALFEGT